jgi:hypothetical protein
MDDRNAQVGWTEAQWNRVRVTMLRTVTGRADMAPRPRTGSSPTRPTTTDLPGALAEPWTDVGGSVCRQGHG